MDKDDLISDLIHALEWAMPYAEKEHERSYPGETYAKDNYVAASVERARNTLALAKLSER